jgi:catechol 2,3-dioxygenase-like lactoylglutathione lyase family enzyme
MAFVADVQRSLEFYARLGFEEVNRFEHDGRLNWVFLQSGGARLMLSRASDPIDPGAQAILFYVYTRDVEALRRDLLAAGLPVGEITRPFYMPGGEVRLTDPDGHVLLCGQDA